MKTKRLSEQYVFDLIMHVLYLVSIAVMIYSSFHGYFDTHPENKFRYLFSLSGSAILMGYKAVNKNKINDMMQIAVWLGMFAMFPYGLLGLMFILP